MGSICRPRRMELRAGVVAVPPAYTSQDCSECGKRLLKSLSTRTHICEFGSPQSISRVIVLPTCRSLTRPVRVVIHLRQSRFNIEPLIFRIWNGIFAWKFSHFRGLKLFVKHSLNIKLYPLFFYQMDMFGHSIILAALFFYSHCILTEKLLHGK